MQTFCKNINGITIKEKLEKAIKNIFANQPDINDFTSATSQTEWNLAHHLANEIQKDLVCLIVT